MPYYNNRFMGGYMQPKPEPCKPQCTKPGNVSDRPKCSVEDHMSTSRCRDSGEWCQDIFKNASGPLAMAGVVWQKSISPAYDVEEAFVRGTVFKELDKPFLGKGGCRR